MRLGRAVRSQPPPYVAVGGWRLACVRLVTVWNRLAPTKANTYPEKMISLAIPKPNRTCSASSNSAGRNGAVVVGHLSRGHTVAPTVKRKCGLCGFRSAGVGSALEPGPGGGSAPALLAFHTVWSRI